MRSTVLFFLIINLSSILAQDLIPYYQNGKYGYCNIDKSIIIKPQFDGCGFFNDGLAWIKQKGKFGYIDKKGKIIVNPVFANTSNFKNGAAIVNDGLNYYVIDKNGKKLNKQGLQHAFRVADSLFACDTGYDIWQVIDNTGKKMYEFEDLNIMYFENTDYVTYLDSITKSDIYLNLRTGKTQTTKPNIRINGNINTFKVVETKPKSHAEEYSTGFGLIDSKNDTIVPTKYHKLFKDDNNMFFVYHTLKNTKDVSQIFITSKNKKTKFIEQRIHDIEFNWNNEPYAYKLIKGKYYFLCQITADDLPFMQYFICVDEDGNVFYTGNKY